MTNLFTLLRLIIYSLTFCLTTYVSNSTLLRNKQLTSRRQLSLAMYFQWGGVVVVTSSSDLGTRVPQLLYR